MGAAQMIGSYVVVVALQKARTWMRRRAALLMREWMP